MDDPMAVVQKVDDAFGLDPREDLRAAMQAHVDANPEGKHGRHENNIEDYGQTREMIENRFAFYTNDDRWPISA